jgi:hypothetical protein
MTGTKLADVALRKSLVEGGEAAVASSTDPLIAWVRKIEPQIRAERKWYEDNIESAETPAGEKIGKAHFAVYGKSSYPDATFTLRLAFGTVKGYPMNGTEAPPRTTFYGLYGRAYDFNMKPPFDLPARYLDSSIKQKLDLSTPFNFVSTCDITGGNSGSPVFNGENFQLEGLLVRGQKDFVKAGSCYVSMVYPTTGSGGEDVTRSSEWAASIPKPVRGRKKR